MNDPILPSVPELPVPVVSSPLAATDAEAVALFLRERAARSVHTALRYQRECRRFMAWLQYERCCSLAALGLADLHAYQAFLRAPALRWQHPGVVPEQPDWVPFPNALGSGRAIDQVMAVVGSLLAFLHAQGHTPRNPAFRLRRQGESFARGHGGADKALTRDQWQFLLQGLKGLPERTLGQQRYKERMRYLLSVAYGTACREEELCSHCHNALAEGDLGWSLNLRGKGSRRRLISLNEGVMAAIWRYRAFCKAPSGLQADDRFPFAPPLLPVRSVVPYLCSEPVSTRQMRRLWQGFLRKLVSASSEIDERFAEALLAKGFHSLRHTALTRMLNDEGVSLEQARLFAGHAHINTTKGYVLTEFSDLAAQTRNHFIDWDRA